MSTSAVGGSGAALTFLLAVGCSSPAVTFREHQFGWSLEGRPIVGWTVTSEDPPPVPLSIEGDGGENAGGTGAAATGGVETLLLFAAIHGNEPLGAPLLERFLEELRDRPELVRGKRLVVVPVANPDGLEQGSRRNANRVDLNRNFPSASWRKRRRHGLQPASEPETRVLVSVVERFQPARILSVHSPLHCINYDGPAAGLAEAMARASSYPVKASIGYATPGSFGSWAGADRGIPVITLELRKGIREEELWDELGEAVMAFVRG